MTSSDSDHTHLFASHLERNPCGRALAITGEVLIAAAMRRLGDLDLLRDHPGLRGYLGPTRAVLSSPLFLIGALCMAPQLLRHALHPLHRRPLARRPRHGLAHLHRQRCRRKDLST